MTHVVGAEATRGTGGALHIVETVLAVIVLTTLALGDPAARVWAPAAVIWTSRQTAAATG